MMTKLEVDLNADKSVHMNADKACVHTNIAVSLVHTNADEALVHMIADY